MQRHSVTARWAKSRHTPAALGVHVVGALLVAAGELIAEGDVAMHVIANRLHPPPSGRRVLEQAPGQIDHAVDFAVTAGQQK